jgi:hypothetical protein
MEEENKKESSEDIKKDEKKEHAYHEHKIVHSANKSQKLETWKIVSAVLAILLIVSIFTGGFKFASPGTPTKGTATSLSPDQASKKAVSYINDNLLQPGTQATLKSTQEANGLYKVKIDVGGKEFDSYVSTDGSLLFPTAVDLTQKPATPETPQTPATPANVPKKDKPVVELFVMSHCPFGTQMEKGLLPVVQLLGNKMDWTVKFVSYSMHGKVEVDEELLQYCIQTDMKSKYVDYLSCFLKEGKTEDCLTQVGIKRADLKDCLDKTDTEFKITESFNDKSTWSGGRYPPVNIYKEDNTKYGVQGSPTFVINGVLQEGQGRDANSILKTVCAAFTNAPTECTKQLSAAQPSAGFGFEAAGTANNNAGCGT